MNDTKITPVKILKIPFSADDVVTLPPAGHSFTVPCETARDVLDWLVGNTVIVLKERWKELESLVQLPCHVKILSVQPNDVLVVHAPGSISMKSAVELRDHIQSLLPSDVKVMVIGDGITLSVLRKEDTL